MPVECNKSKCALHADISITKRIVARNIVLLKWNIRGNHLKYSRSTTDFVKLERRKKPHTPTYKHCLEHAFAIDTT